MASSQVSGTGEQLHIPPRSIAASTVVNGSPFDRAGFQGVEFEIMVGAGDKTLDVKIQRDDAVGMASPTDVSGAAITQISGGTTNVTKIIRVYSSSEQWLRAVVTTGSGGSTDRQVCVRAQGYDRFSGSVRSDDINEIIEVIEQLW